MAEYLAIIYVISSGTGHYKIGRTVDLKKRLMWLQTGCPFPLAVIHSFKCPNAAAIEKQLHKKFSLKRAEGEWFSLNSQDLEYLLSLGTDEDDPTDTFDDLASSAVGNSEFIEDWIDINTPLWGAL